MLKLTEIASLVVPALLSLPSLPYLTSMVIGGRKTVTVYADSEAEASSRAQGQNPGWTVISVKKVNPKDPISRMYSVTLENK